LTSTNPVNDRRLLDRVDQKRRRRNPLITENHATVEAGTTAEAQGNVSVPTAMEEVHQGVKEVAVNPAQVGLSVAKENPQATIAAAATTVATTAATAEGKAILVIAEGKPGILLNKKSPDHWIGRGFSYVGIKYYLATEMR
jgi:hypothetical protein